MIFAPWCRFSWQFSDLGSLSSKNEPKQQRKNAQMSKLHKKFEPHPGFRHAHRTIPRMNLLAD